MEKTTICILGGTGFVGQQLAARLVSLGYQVLVPSRHPERHREVLVLPDAQLKRANIHNQDELKGIFSGVDIVINLVGILNEKGNDGLGFQHVHVDLTRKVIEACKQTGVHRLLHMSALNADVNGPSYYLCSKGKAESEVLGAESEQLHVTCFRPSIIFGPGDGLFNRFATLLRMTPFVFPLACAESLISPVYIGDVVDAYSNALENEESFGQTYDLCGPDRFSLKQIVEYTSQQLGKYHLVISLSPGMSCVQARMLEFIPGKPFSRDNYASLQIDSVCSTNGLDELGIHPTAVDSIVPGYLAQQSTRGSYDKYRQQANK